MKTKIFTLAIVLFVCLGRFAQTKSDILAHATADSSRVAVNKKAGWQQYASYLTPVGTDSVMLETVVQHNKTGLVMSQEQLIGQIKQNKFRPKTVHNLSFSLLSNSYSLRIEPNGKCYLKLLAGTLPDSDPVVIPVRVLYKP